MRLEQAKRDHFRKLAKKEGYRSRAAFKLQQMNNRFRFIRANDKVVDIGCAPGGWLEVASEIVGPGGLVLGVDIVPVKPVGKNVTILQEDVTSPGFQEKVFELLGKSKANCVLADLSPKLSGVWELDQFKQTDLCHTVIDLLPTNLKEGGSVVMKAFHGDELQPLIQRLKKSFGKVVIVKPEASRKESSEVYLFARPFTGQVFPRQNTDSAEEHQSSEHLDSDEYDLLDNRLPEGRL